MHTCFSCYSFDVPDCPTENEVQYYDRCSVIGDRNGPFADCIRMLTQEVNCSVNMHNISIW